ncbi:MAG TPA: anthranilate synthase component I [Spongiibacteraceae bacterium]|nr:anthranilate synthase component I [Spongiibacteraceae bacterium]HCS27842.1 anthranilate synthase component I [Spongiibacteraceae bacterium]
MTPETFAELAQQPYNRIPVHRDVLADLDTPLSAYLKLARGPYSYLFESVEGGEKWGRYSIIGLRATTVLTVRGHEISVSENGKVVESSRSEDPLAFVEAFQQRYSAPDLEQLPAFNGGLVGYFGYDTVRYVEPRLAASCPPDKLGNPDIVLMLSDELVVFDNLAGVITLIVHVDPARPDAYLQAQRRLDELEQLMAGPAPELTSPLTVPGDLPESAFESEVGEEGYYAMVERVKEYTLAGDVMQVVPSQRLSTPFSADPINLYRALRRLNPSPYMFYLNLDDFHIVGSSPEILARVEGDDITLRPIAGTRRRGHTDEEDRAMEAELLADPKEIAEHLMLIDLGRNDVGRVAQTGTVVVTDQMVVERYSHVMHIVSNVTGKLKAGMSAMDVLRASLPAGTLSGAPKVRAMEIIDELEPVKRGVYGGAVGYLGFNGNMDTAIAIRTAVIKNDRLYVQAGGGIVADSVPRLEWKETMNKARAMFRAAAMVQGVGKNDTAQGGQ